MKLNCIFDNNFKFQICSEIVNDIISQFYLKENFLENISVIGNSFINENSRFIINKKNLTEIPININENKNNNSELYFYKTYSQNNMNLCGFHSLFNIIYYIRFLKIMNNPHHKNINESKLLLEKMNNGVKFWKFYKKILKFLKDNISPEDPDLKSVLNNGALERHQLKFIFENNKIIKNKISSDNFNSIHINRFFFGFNVIQRMNTSEIVQLQEALEQMKNYSGEVNLVYVILLGVLNHWSVLILSKKDYEEIKFDYLDSLNTINIFNFKNEDELNKFVKNKFIEKEQFFKTKMTEWSKNCYMQRLKDLNFCIKTFYQILLNKTEDYSFYKIIIEDTMNRVISTFENYNKIQNICRNSFKEIESENKLIKDNLNSWLTREYHPKILFEDVIRTIDIFKYSEKLKKLKIFSKIEGWIYYSIKIKEKLNITTEEFNEEDNLILRYFSFIDILTKILYK